MFLTILVKLYLVKMCPIFASSASNCLTRYKQILSECSLRCKNVLNFTSLTIKFHNHNHVTYHSQHISSHFKKLNCFQKHFDHRYYCNSNQFLLQDWGRQKVYGTEETDSLNMVERRFSTTCNAETSIINGNTNNSSAK